MRKIFVAWLCFVLVSGALAIIVETVSRVGGSQDVEEHATYIVSEPFRITSNTDFATYANGGGDGSASNPWVIENLEVNGTVNTTYCIEISLTSDYFILRNCTLRNASRGLDLIGVSNAIIYNNTITNNSVGICALSSANNRIEGNNFTNNKYGLEYPTVLVPIPLSENDIVSANRFESNGYGIYIAWAENITVVSNSLLNNTYGIYVYDSATNLKFHNNTLLGDGISLEYSEWHSITIDASNTVNGRSVHYLKNQTGGTVPVDAGQIILANCTQMTVADQNLSGGDVGITLMECANITLENITAVDNDIMGINMRSTSNTTMTGINASNCGTGITIDYWNSFCNQIENCTANNNSNTGISISGKRNHIANVTCNGNGRRGIVISGQDNIVEQSTILGNECGVVLDRSNNKIRFNNVSDGDAGIQINGGADYNKIYGNQIWNNDFGIALWQSTNNSFYENTIANSTGKSGSSPYYYNETGIDIWPSGMEYSFDLLEVFESYPSQSKYKKAINISEVSFLDVHIWGHTNAPDLDMAIFLDGTNGQPKDGVAQWQEIITQDDMPFDAYCDEYGSGFYAYSSDSDSNEAIRFSNPLNGTYLIYVLGYYVTGDPGQFDLNITLLNYTSSGIIGIDSDCNNIVNNNITGNNIGINLIESSEQNLIHYNNIVDNAQQAHDDGINLWNRDYPFGGNHWSDYVGSDSFSGPGQDLVGSDSIGDAPYMTISGGSGGKDQYPFVEQTDGIYLDDEAPYSYLIQRTSYYGEWGVWQADTVTRDNYSGIANLEIWHRFSQDNITWDAWELFSNESYSWGWSTSWSPFKFPWIEGYHEFHSIAIDEEGNREMKEHKSEASWAADLEPPQSNFDNITGYWYNSPLTLNATAHDNMSGVATVSLWYRHSTDSANWTNWSAIGTDAESPWSWNLNFSYGEGHYEFDSIAVDNVRHPESEAPYGWDPFEPSLAVGYDSTQPVANAGTNRHIQMGTEINLNGTGSTDNVEINNYSWNFTYDGMNIASYETNFNHTFEIPGIYSITLNVTDPAGNWDTGAIRVTVYDGEPPVAQPGSDRNATAGGIVTFDGSASTDDVDIVNYTWSFTHNGTTVTLYGASPIYTFWGVGNHTVTLTVSDAAGNTGTDTMVVRVTPPLSAETPGDIMPLFITVTAVVAAVVILALWFLRGRKPRPADATPPGDTETT